MKNGLRLSALIAVGLLLGCKGPDLRRLVTNASEPPPRTRKPEILSPRFLTDLNRRIELNEEQKEKITSIVDEDRPGLATQWEEISRLADDLAYKREKFNAASADTVDRIRKQLRPAQAKKLGKAAKAEQVKKAEDADWQDRDDFFRGLGIDMRED